MVERRRLEGKSVLGHGASQLTVFQSHLPCCNCRREGERMAYALIILSSVVEREDFEEKNSIILKMRAEGLERREQGHKWFFY